FNAADCGQNAVEKVEDRLASADQRAFATCRIERSTQRRILGPRNLRHVFRRDAIEVRLHTLSRIVVHNRLLAELEGSPDFIKELPSSNTTVCRVKKRCLIT